MGKTFRVFPVTGLILVALTVGMTRAAGGDRQPVPPAAQLSRAEATIRKLFRDEYERRTPADRQALARKLLGEGQATANDAAARYVCYREAHDLATLGGDLPTAFVAANTIAKDFAVDPRDIEKMKLATYVAVARQIETPEANAAFAEIGLNLLSHMVASENFDDIDRLLAPMEAAANKAKQVSLVTRVQSSRDEATELRRESQKAALAAEELKKSPDDPGANLTLGRHLAFVKGDFNDAMPLLAKSSDPTLKTLAHEELARPVDVKSVLRLAEKQTGLARTDVQRHAQEQYQRVYPSLAGLDAARVAARLPAGALAQAAPAVAGNAPSSPVTATVPATQPEGAQAEVTRYWWVTRLRPPGMRVWRKIAADTWQEVDPAGSIKQFRIVSHDDPQLGTGLVVRDLADLPLEVWVPKLVDGNLTYFRRTDRDSQWHAMGAVHVGDPPAGEIKDEK